MPTFEEAIAARNTADKLKAQKAPLSPDQQQTLDAAEKTFARRTEQNILNQQAGIEKRGGKLHPTTAKALADAQAILARPSPAGPPATSTSRIGEPPLAGSKVAGDNQIDQTSPLDQHIAAPEPQAEKFPSKYRSQDTPKFQFKDGAPTSENTAPSENSMAPGTPSPQLAHPPEESNSEAARQRRQAANDYIRAHIEPRENPISKHITIDKKDNHGLAMEKAALLADIVHDNDFMTPLVMGRVPSNEPTRQPIARDVPAYL